MTGSTKRSRSELTPDFHPVRDRPDAVRRMGNITWSIRDDPDTATRFDEDNDIDAPSRPLTAQERSAPVAPLGQGLSIHMEIGRYGQATDVIHVPPCDNTVQGVMRALHQFYHTPRCIQDFVPFLDDDTWGYAASTCDAIRRRHEPRGWIAIMGELRWFEGLVQLEDGTWRLGLGS